MAVPQDQTEDVGELATQIQNYHMSARRSVVEYHSLGDGDESLMKYNQSLGITDQNGAPVEYIYDPSYEGMCIFTKFALQFPHHPGVNDGAGEFEVDLANTGNQFTIAEGATYQIYIDFHVQRELLSGLVLHINFKKSMLPAQKLEWTVGSYSPGQQQYTSKWEEIPNGMLARGTVTATCWLTDFDGNEHQRFMFKFTVAKINKSPGFESV